MSKMTIVQLGVIVVVVCLSTQVVSQTGRSTKGENTTPNPTNPTLNTSSSSGNSTSSSGAGISLYAGTFSFLIPFITAASFLQRYC